MAKWRVTLSTKGSAPNVRQLMGPIVAACAEAAKQEWIREARRSLHTTARAYIEGIQDPELNKNVAIIRLEGWLPNALEDGLSPFDMKKGLLQGPKARRSKEGNPYTIVPFGMKSAGAAGPSPPVMPAGVYGRAKKLEFGQSLKLPIKWEDLGRKTRKSPNPAKWESYKWKTSPYAGVTKVRKYPGMLPTSKAGQMAGYKTFRVVSSKSDPSSWIHPGFRARGIVDKAAANFESIFPEIINKVMG